MGKVRGYLYRRNRNGKRDAFWSVEIRVDGVRVLQRQTDAREKRHAERIRDELVAKHSEEDTPTARYARHAKDPVQTHVDEYIALVASRSTAKHVKQTRTRLEASMAGMGVEKLGELALSKALMYTAELTVPGTLRKDGTRGPSRPASVKTRNDVTSLLCSFGAWLEDMDRVHRSPFRRLRRVHASDADRTRVRQALKLEEVERLCKAAVVRPVQQYRRTHPRACIDYLRQLEARGRDRAELYLFATFTGSRHDECATVRWADVDLVDEYPSVTHSPEVVKNKTRQPVPLLPWLVKLLQERRSRRSVELGRPVRPTEPVFHVPSNLLAQLRKDATWASVPLVNEKGEVLDFHALRTTLRTMLDRVEPALRDRKVDLVMRHAPRGVGAKHYSRMDLVDATEGISQLAEPQVDLSEDTSEDFGPRMSSDGAACRSEKPRGGDERPWLTTG